MKVYFTSRAFSDREAIFDYIHDRSPTGARNVMSRLRHAIRRLSRQPLSGVETDVEGVRVIFVGRYPFRVFYRVRDDTIEILRILHTARGPGEVD